MYDNNLDNLARKVYSASKGQLLSITFEGLLEAIQNVRNSLTNKDQKQFDFQMQRVLMIIDELFYSLDFTMDLSKDLGAIYYYCRNQIFKAMITKEIGLIDLVERIIRPIYKSFRMISETDEQNKSLNEIQGLVAGLTYGKNTLEEVVINREKKGVSV